MAQEVRPQAILLSPEPPWPPHGGGRLRTLSIIEYLRQRYHLDLVLFHEPGELRPEAPAGLARRLLTLSLSPHSRRPAARAWRNARRLVRGVVPLVDRFAGFEKPLAAWLAGHTYDIAVVEHLWCAPYWRVLQPHAGRCVLDLHNVESSLLGRLAASRRGAAGLALREFARRCRRDEARWLPRYDRLLVTSATDLAQCDGRASIVPNGLPWQEIGRRDAAGPVVFGANFGYTPNEDAAQWFARYVWPRVRRLHPGARWLLLGRGSDRMLRLLDAPPGASATGEVADTAPWLDGASLAVAPLLAGSGTRVKIVEAWAAGIPVVSTRLGAEGLKGEHGVNLLLADEPEEFAQAVVKVLSDSALAAVLARSGRVQYEVEHSWPAVWAALQNAGL